MARARISLEPAWLLARRPYRETSLLLEILSLAHGRVGLVARAARGPRSKWSGVLQPFQPLLLSWVESGELGTLTAAETAGAPVSFAGEQVFSGWYINELLLCLLPRHDAHPALHALYAQTLEMLPQSGAQVALRRFEARLLEALGYGLPLAGEFDPAARYRYDPERGATLSMQDDAGTISGAALIALRERRYDEPETGREIRRLLRTAIDRQLGGRELASRRLLRVLREGRNARK